MMPPDSWYMVCSALRQFYLLDTGFCRLALELHADGTFDHGSLPPSTARSFTRILLPEGILMATLLYLRMVLTGSPRSAKRRRWRRPLTQTFPEIS